MDIVKSVLGFGAEINATHEVRWGARIKTYIFKHTPLTALAFLGNEDFAVLCAKVLADYNVDLEAKCKAKVKLVFKEEWTPMDDLSAVDTAKLHKMHDLEMFLQKLTKAK